ncbi:hypothetical protein CK203_049683, partial [Vitis vinifera]
SNWSSGCIRNFQQEICKSKDGSTNTPCQHWRTPGGKMLPTPLYQYQPKKIVNKPAWRIVTVKLPCLKMEVAKSNDFLCDLGEDR